MSACPTCDKPVKYYVAGHLGSGWVVAAMRGESLEPYMSPMQTLLCEEGHRWQEPRPKLDPSIDLNQVVLVPPDPVVEEGCRKIDELVQTMERQMCASLRIS